LLAIGDALWRRENLRGVLQHVPRQARIDHPGILDVEVGEDAGGEEKTRGHDGQKRQTKCGSPETLLHAKSQSLTPPGWTHSL